MAPKHLSGGWVRMSVVIAMGVIGAMASSVRGEESAVIFKSEFIFEKAPFVSCHASTIVETKEGLLAAWFGGTDEGKPDVGIWVSRYEGQGWSGPVEVATGQSSEGKRLPCWNPVLFQVKDGPVVLFYKVGPSPSTWWGMRMTSRDGGKSWSKPQRLGEGILGPIKNKPIGLANGDLLCPSSTEHEGWRVHLEQTGDLGETARKVVPAVGGEPFGAIQPTILAWGNGRMQILCRSRQKAIVEAWSADGGRTWGALKRTELPNPNSGIDAVMLRQGMGLLVYNHTTLGRSPLNVAMSKDGERWEKVLTLESEPGEYSYPAVIQTSDGRVHVTYTWKRQRIRHVVVELRN